MSASGKTVLLLGASRGVGFAAYEKLVAESAPDSRFVLLLRSVDAFKSSENAAKLNSEALDRTTFVKGDAHDSKSIREALDAAGESLSTIVFTIGFTPPSDLVSSVKVMFTGMKLNPPDLCCRGLTVLVAELSKSYSSYQVKPKLILVSSMGMGKNAHDIMPGPIKPLYSWMLESPHADKIGMEVVMDRVIKPDESKTLPPRFIPTMEEVKPEVMTPEKFEQLPKPFFAPQDVCVVRPALLTDGDAKGFEAYRRVQEGPDSTGQGTYSISRKDTGGFVAELALGKRSDATEWWGKQPILAY